jgi:hypothetical protein
MIDVDVIRYRWETVGRHLDGAWSNGIKIGDAEMRALDISGDTFHAE